MDETIQADSEATTTEEQEQTESLEEIKQKLQEAEDAKRQILARAHKAEQELKSLKNQPKETVSSLTPEEVDKKILLSQGVSEELIATLEKLAKLNGTSILAAQQDPVYLAVKEKREQDEKNAKASLPASRGSGQVKQQKTTASPNLSAEEHKELWRKANN